MGLALKLNIAELVSAQLPLAYLNGAGWFESDEVTGIWAERTADQALVAMLVSAKNQRDRVSMELEASSGVWYGGGTLDPAVLAGMTQDEQDLVTRIAFWHTITDSAIVLKAMPAIRGILTQRPDLFDTRPLLLGTPDGVLAIGAGLLGYAPEARVTRSTAVNPWGDRAYTPEFLLALESIPTEHREWLRWNLARGLVAEMARYFLVNIGSGANGKSMFLSCLMNALGDYSTQISGDALTGRESGYHLAKLRGRRFVYLEELDADQAIKPTIWKILAGTGTITARQIREDVIVFPATWTVAINTNHEPNVSTGDGGVARRAKIINWPFKYVRDPNPAVPTERAINIQDPERWAANPANQAQMLTWLLDVVTDPEPDEPVSVSGAVAEWVADNDKVGMFLSERCVFGEGVDIFAHTLVDAFRQWHSQNGYQQITSVACAKQLKAALSSRRDVRRLRLASGYQYQGLSLREFNFADMANGVA